jgi:hypothetical protein
MAVFACLAVLAGAPGAQAGSVTQAGVATQAQTRAPASAPARKPTPTPAPAKAPARAPSEPPLSTGGTAALSPEAEASASVSSSGGDPLVDNGLGSPLCREGAGAELSQTSARNCRSSGFEAAQAPTGDYGFDVHINTGVTDIANDVDAEVLNAVQWSWTLLVAVVHGMIVMLEWSYTIDLLDSSVMGGITRGLRETQATFTQPWLVLALAVASVLALYHGIVRRQVTETLGQTLLMAAMMLGGFWVIVNPLGTVGALGAWANEASLGTLSAVATGTPDHPERTLANSMGSIFNGAIGGPWCFMEFGNVRWCNDPARLDPRLRAAALKIATEEQLLIGCKLNTGPITICVAPGSAQAQALNQGAELLRGAHTNGELFLALPANGAARNAINQSGSLFHVLCGSSEEPCQGPTAREAEFRTGGGTLWRIAGLVLFWAGVLGMVLLLGFIALHLLGAAIFSMFLLLLAPAAVIAPALGDGGRAAFRTWAARLLGAVCSKLIYSFLLGIVLLMQRTLLSFSAFGWAAQWLFVSAMWWGLFMKRHQVLGFAHGTQPGSRQHGIGGLRLASRLMAARELGRVGGMVRRKFSPPAPSAEKRQQITKAAQERAKAFGHEQVATSLESNYQEAQSHVREAPTIQGRIAGKQTRLGKLRREHAIAQADTAKAKAARESALGDPNVYSYRDRKRAEARFGRQERSHRKRAESLRGRMGVVQGEIAAERSSLDVAQQRVKEGERAKRTTGSPHTSKQFATHEQLLDVQAELPDHGRAAPGGEKRDYARLAGIGEYGQKEFEELSPGGQRVARLKIDRELAARKEASVAARDVAARHTSSPPTREEREAVKDVNHKLEQVSTGAPSAPSPRTKKGSPPGASSRHNSRTERRSAGAGESGPVRDAREVAAHRRRQLGREGRR